MEYISRQAEKDIERALRSAGAVLVVGPKFCGKTTTSMRFQKSFVKLNTNSRIQLERLNPMQTLGGDKLIEEGAKSLKLMKEKIATKSSERHPSFLMVLTARGSLYQREDGIYVVPINCLRD